MATALNSAASWEICSGWPCGGTTCSRWEGARRREVRECVCCCDSVAASAAAQLHTSAAVVCCRDASQYTATVTDPTASCSSEPETKDEADRSRWLRKTSLRVPTLNCFSANTTSENGVKTNKRSTSSLVDARNRVVVHVEVIPHMFYREQIGETCWPLKYLSITQAFHTHIKWLDYSPPTKAKRTLYGGVTSGFLHVEIVPDDTAGLRFFFGNPPFLPPLHSGAAPYSVRFTILGYQDADLGSPLVDDRPIWKAVKHKVVSGVVWTNRTMVSSNTEPSHAARMFVSPRVDKRRARRLPGAYGACMWRCKIFFPLAANESAVFSNLRGARREGTWR
ncbi:hypothetical protein PR048_008825 [Dryococelus australis]|uniref:Uncharacterized protein n=1 Tax=Dryococelus australis TaxID=614101 RepID=A0ABQ9HZ08_9NEOP|nr:hypothetical protein PR048_008825 [Dryococelus australis]